jgi:hypothetical protein
VSTAVGSAGTSAAVLPLRQASTTCGQVGDLSDGDRTLFLDGEGEEANSGHLEVSTIECVLRELKTPTYVVEQMNQTRALDGQQTATWGAFEARWTYHPDAGLNLSVHQR